MARSVAHPRGTPDDGELALLATDGDGNAFAELYDRHEQRVYGFCMRMLSTPHDAADATQETFVRMLARLPALQERDLHFVAYTLATARNVCYDMIRARRTVQPVAEQPQPRVPQAAHVEEDPERFALLAATREDVRAANAALPARQREVLALREVELLSYDEIGELMDLNRNAVAQLVSRARIKLGELLRGSALASVGARTPDCERALPLLGALQDEQDCDPPSDLDWVRAHLAGCETCRLSLAAMQEAGASYRAIGLLAPAVWLRHATIARAAEYVGADWSHVAGSAPGAHASGASSSPAGLSPNYPPGLPGSATQNTAEQTAVGGAAAAGQHTRTAVQRDARSDAGDGTERRRAWTTRRRLTLTLLAGALLALGVVLVAMAGDTRNGHLASRTAAAVTPAASARTVTSAARFNREPDHATAAAISAKPVSPGQDRASHVHATSSSTKPAPQDSDDPRPATHRHRRQAQSHRPAPAKPTPQPSAPTTTPTTTTPAAATPTASTPATPPPVSTPTTTSTTSTPTTTTPTTTTESPPPTTPARPGGGGLIP
jgi:RNA polymerase sigma factor (sigma-70 family)